MSSKLFVYMYYVLYVGYDFNKKTNIYCNYLYENEPKCYKCAGKNKFVVFHINIVKRTAAASNFTILSSFFSWAMTSIQYEFLGNSYAVTTLYIICVSVCY